jgi:tetratricopeptide (TPR) repeat protein
MSPSGFVVRTLLLVMTTMSSLLVFGQDDRMTEDDIQIEDRFVQANLLAANGKRKEAILLLDTLRREMPQPNSAVYLALAKLYFAQKDLNGCESNLLQAMKTDVSNVWVLDFGHDYYRETGRFDEAIATIDKIIALEPHKSVWYDKKIQWLVSIGKYGEAIGAIQAKEGNFGFNTAGSLKKIDILQKIGNVDEALTELEKIISAYPAEKKYLRLGAGLLHEAGRVSETRSYLERILALDPQDADARTGLALLGKETLSDTGYIEALSPLITDVNVGIDKKVQALLPLLTKQAEEGDSLYSADLLFLAAELCRVHPQEAKAFSLYGDVLKNAGNYEDAASAYQRTLALSKRNFLVWEQLMFCHEKTNEVVPLLQTAKEAIDYFPNQAMSYIFLASAQISIGDLKAAKANLEEATLIAAGNKDLESRIQRVWGQWAYSSKDVDKATDFVERAIQLSDGQNGDAWELKGDLIAAKGNLAEARLHWQKALKTGGWKKTLAEKLNLKN